MHLPVMLAAIAWSLAPIDAQSKVCTPAGCTPAKPSAGADVAPATSAEAIVRIVHRGAGGSSLGSGAIIAHAGGKSFVLTCAHLFEGAGSIRVVSRRGSFDARVLAIDRAHDLALLTTERVGIQPLRVAASELVGHLTACGFGGDGRLRCIRGSVLGSAIAAGAVAPSTLMAGSVRSGDSGGPVIDAAGRVVAVVWGERAGRTYVMGGRPLAKLLQRLPRRGSEPPSRNVDEGRLARIEQKLNDLSEASRRSDSSLSNRDLDRLGDRFATAIAGLENRVKGLVRRIGGSVGDADTALEGLSAPIAGRWARLGAIGLSLGAPTAAGWLAWRAWRQRRQRQVRDPGRPIAVDTPPPPQRVAPETHFVSYERDDFAKAHQWASEQLARKFPGSVELLTSLDSLIRQQLAATDRSS